MALTGHSLEAIEVGRYNNLPACGAAYAVRHDGRETGLKNENG
jgi:hypothetical protein